MTTRRQFLGTTAMIATASTLFAGKAKRFDEFKFSGFADDERYWSRIGREFEKASEKVDFSGASRPVGKRGLSNFNNYEANLSRRSPQDREHMLGSLREVARGRLADMINAPSNQIAFTASATEALVTIIFGMELSRGDEVVISNQEYPAVRNAWYQRARRDGIVINEVRLPVASENDREITNLFAKAMNDRTRFVGFSHVINGTGQRLPAADIAAEARSRNIPVLLDAALSFGTHEIDVTNMDIQFAVISQPKMSGLSGASFVYMEESYVERIYPLYGHENPESRDIRKFESANTYSLAAAATWNEALDLEAQIGRERKLERLSYLTHTWTSQVSHVPGVVLNTANGRGIANVGIEGIAPETLAKHLADRYRIQTLPITHHDYQGVRISVDLSTRVEEVNKLAEALTQIATYGLR